MTRRINTTADTTAILLIVLVCLSCYNYQQCQACTNIIVTPGASQKGSMMLAYSADSHTSMGQLYHYPPSSSDENEMLDIYEWDTGKYFGQIPQSSSPTYNVVGNCNEHNVCIGETSYGAEGPSEIIETGFHPDAILDYGSLIYVTLQRSVSSKHAVEVMTTLVNDYGYRSAGETFSVVDPNEAYVVEMQTKGAFDKRAVWVSCRVPDGTIVAHANHARITNEFLVGGDCTSSGDVVDFAIEHGLYNATSPSNNFDSFSYSDVYNPVPAYTLRYSDARVWDIYRAFVPEGTDRHDFDRRYLPRAMGTSTDYKDKEALPLWFIPETGKVSLEDIRHRMSSHYEHTPLGYTKDVASGIFEMPYRPRPNNWEYTSPATGETEMYVNERPVAVEKTGFNFIAELRPLSTENKEYGVAHRRLQTVFWYAQDDCSTSPRIPQFPSSKKLSKHYDTGLGPQRGETIPIMKMDFNKAFWIQNLVSNLAYFRWKDIYPVLQTKLNEVQLNFEDRIQHFDREIEHIIHHYHCQRKLEADDNVFAHDDDVEEMLDRMIVDKLTQFSIEVGDEMHHEWTKYWGYLFVRYRDLIDMTVDNTDKGCGCGIHEIGLSHQWQTRIIDEKPNHWNVYMDLSNDDSEMTVAAVKAYQEKQKAEAQEERNHNKHHNHDDQVSSPSFTSVEEQMKTSILENDIINSVATSVVQQEEHLRHSQNNNKKTSSSSWMMNMISSSTNSDHPLTKMFVNMFQ